MMCRPARVGRHHNCNSPSQPRPPCEPGGRAAVAFPFPINPDLFIRLPRVDPATLEGTGRGPFEAAIEAAPERLVYADWLDEWCDPASQHLANAQRWLAVTNKRPRLQGVIGGLCDWWSEQATVSDARWQIPAGVFERMPGSSWYPNSKD